MLAAAAWWLWLRIPPLPEGLIQANGRIEGDHFIVAGKLPGKVAELLSREGDSAEHGRVLARLDDAQVRAKVDQARQAAAALQAQVQAAQTGLEVARKDLLLAIQTAEVKALAAQLDQARAGLAEAESVRADLTIAAPASGIITQRLVNAGEVVAAGSPLFDIVDHDRLYLQVYVPGKDIGKVRLGLPARIYNDAFPDRPLAATVRYIAAQAQFTPKEVQTPDERVKLVYEVRLYLDANPEHRATPGLPADAVIRWKEDAPWAKPRW